jgi:hypothetical protein
MGGLLVAFFIGAESNNREYEAYHMGVQDGLKRAKNYNDVLPSLTLKELFDKKFEGNFDAFKEYTSGIIYEIEPSVQLFIIDVKTLNELHTYYDYDVVTINYDSEYKRPVIRKPNI